MESRRTPDLSLLGERSPFARATGQAPGRRQSRTSGIQQTGKSSQQRWQDQHTHQTGGDGDSPMFMHYTISQDLSGDRDTIMAARLAALGARADRLAAKEPAFDSTVEPIERSQTGTSESSDGEESDEAETASVARSRRLACPFYKHNNLAHRPCEKYMAKKIDDEFLEHLYIKHNQKRPDTSNYCSRCFKVAVSPARLDDHIVFSRCKNVKLPSPGVVKRTEQLKAKLGYFGAPGYVSERSAPNDGLWHAIYSRLFPGEPPCLDPYV